LARYDDKVLEALIHEATEEADDLEKEVAPEGAGSRFAAKVTILTSFSSHGFQTTPAFRDAWIRLSAAGRVGTAREFRKLFCEADHYEVKRVVNGKRVINRVVVAWGHPVVYAIKTGQKPLLGAIAPKDWHLSQVGRSVVTPAFCKKSRS
jgi:hypothetical protein